jgi:hypothetical protein
MFWNNMKEIREWMITIASRLTDIQIKMDGIVQEQTDLQMKMDGIVQEQEDRISFDQVAAKTVDKCQDYMKNVDKLNSMMNELKGCVSIARGAMADKKEMDDMRTILKNMIETCQKYYLYQKNVSDQYFKIDAIYKVLCEKEEKKPSKKRKTVKKKAVSAALES